MGYLERRALKRCQTVLAPYADAGEVVEDFDVGYLGEARVDLIATDRNLWLLPSGGGELIKIPYMDITFAAWSEGDSNGHLRIVTTHGRSLMIEIRTPGGLGADVEGRVANARPASNES